MSKIQSQLPVFALAAIIVALSGFTPRAHAVEGSEYYKEGYSPMFNPYPRDFGRGANRAWTIRYFGPVGIGIDLKRPGMTMEINRVEEGSPADKTGKLKKGQIIESINGVVLKDYDPRIILGNIITEAEATDGVIDLKIKDEGTVRVQIPVMGAYSETWPVDCPKSDKIVRQLADLIAAQDKPSNGSVLFLLSTGEEEDLDVVRRWMQDIEQVGGITWDIGYKGIGVCEYYLRTGDESVLPAIKKSVEDVEARMYNGGWSGRGAPAQFTYSVGTGQVHASGMYAMNFLLMAKLCGVEVDDYVFNESLTQFYRYSGHGNVAYGTTLPEGGFRDNGKTSGLAMAMAVAAQISPEGEKSVYAMARDNSAMKAFYATNWFHAAHTGGGMGEIWHHAAMALMREKRPIPYRSYMDTRRWVMDLSRRFDGSIAIEGMDDRYNRSLTDGGERDWGTFFALTYTYHRKALQIWGAPRSPYAVSSPMPERPWGNTTDDIFNSNEPVYIGEALKLTKEELLNERVQTDASLPALSKMNSPDITEEEMFKYILHPEYGLRHAAMRAVVNHGWDHLTVPLLKSADPRLREAGLLTMAGMFKGRPFPGEQLTSEMFDLAGQILEDPNESWWVALHAAKALGRADTNRIGQHRDRLLELLQYDSVWVQTEAVLTLCNIATEREHYKTVLPAIIATSAGFTVDEASRKALPAIHAAVAKANPDVKTFADPILKKAFVSIPPKLVEPHTGAIMTRGANVVRGRIGSILREIPGGEEFIKRMPKMTVESYKSGLDEDMYQYMGKFEPNDEVVGKWSWAVWPRPKAEDGLDGVDKAITNWLESKKKAGEVKPEDKDSFILEPDGKVSARGDFSNHFWSGNWLIGLNHDHALKMEVRSYDGYDFLIIEQPGKFGGGPDDEGVDAVPDDWHPGYTIYMRVE